MEEWEKDFEEFAQKFAMKHFDGDVELAKQQAIMEDVKGYYRTRAKIQVQKKN